jgi:hypothetical protein
MKGCHERTSPGRALLDFANEGRFRFDAVQINDWAERTLWQKRSATTLGWPSGNRGLQRAGVGHRAL